MIDKYYESERFQNIRRTYENMKDGNTGCHLDSEELIDIAEYYYNLGLQDEALNAANLAFEIYPYSTAPLSFLARYAILVERNREKAEAFANQILDKHDIEYIYTKAEIMVADNQAENADKYLCEYMEYMHYDTESDNVQDFILDVACIFIDYNQYDICEKWLKKSTLTDSETYLELYGKLCNGRGEYEDSEKYFQKLVDNYPYNYEYWNLLASIQFIRNRINESITSSEYAIAINPNDEEAIANKANSLYALGNYDEALKYYKQYTIMTPLNELGEMFQGITLASEDRYEEAIIHLNKALDIAMQNFYDSNGRIEVPESGDPEIRRNLAKIYKEIIAAYHNMHKYQEALNYVDKLEAVGNDSVEANLIRGRIMLAGAERNKAQEYFVTALRKTDDFPRTVLLVATSLYDYGYISTAYNILHYLLNNADLDWTDGFAYLASCCFILGKEDEFNRAVLIASKVNPSEAYEVLADIYPEDTPPEKYPFTKPVKPFMQEKENIE